MTNVDVELPVVQRDARAAGVAPEHLHARRRRDPDTRLVGEHELRRRRGGRAHRFARLERRALDHVREGRIRGRGEEPAPAEEEQGGRGGERQPAHPPAGAHGEHADRREPALVERALELLPTLLELRWRHLAHPGPRRVGDGIDHFLGLAVAHGISSPAAVGPQPSRARRPSSLAMPCWIARKALRR